jgi:quaternary ammonium compound-resistance protein SugE
MVWLILFLAGLMEVAWAVGLKYTDNFTRLTPSILTLIAMAISVWLLAVAMKTLPVGTAYAVWTGIGAVGTVLCGIILFHEPATLARFFCIGMIIGGIVGLKMLS